MSIPATQNRRSCERYKTVQYTALVQRRSRMGHYKSAREAAVVDFNRNGMSLCCEQRYRVGDRLKLSIQSASERITDIHAVVRHAHHVKGECLFGLEFVDNKDFHRVLSGARKSILAGMEGVIIHQLA